MSSKKSETTESQRKIILYLHNQGKSYAEIGEMMDRSRYTIRSIVHRFKSASSLQSVKRTGRPKALNDRERCQIIRKVKKNPRISSTQIAAEFKEEMGKDIHPITVRRALHEENYNSRVARRKPLISKVNQKKRLAYAMEYLRMPSDFWENVLFSDESKFNIFQSDGRQTVWRKPNTELQKQNLAATVKHGGGGVIVWGCMSAAGVGELEFIDGIMDKKYYMEILKRNVKKSAEKLKLPDSFTFQHDNDPKHTAHDVRMWLAHHIKHTLPHPPQSPDLNPIEHLWEELDRRVKKRAISTKTELKVALVEEWRNIGAETPQKLVSSMPRRLEAVIQQKGLATKY